MNWIKNPLMKSVIKAATMRSFSGYASRLIEMLKTQIKNEKLAQISKEEEENEEEINEKKQEKEALIEESEEEMENEAILMGKKSKGETFISTLIFYFSILLKNKKIFYFLLTAAILAISAIFYHYKISNFSPLIGGMKKRNEWIEGRKKRLDIAISSSNSFPTISKWSNINLQTKYGIIHNKCEQLNVIQTQIEELLTQIMNNRERLNEKKNMIIKAELLIECYSDIYRNKEGECEKMEKQWLAERKRN